MKEAAQKLQDRGVDQLAIWLDSTPEKMRWLGEGFDKESFCALKTSDGYVAGVYRSSMQDRLYWGEQA